MKHEPLFQVPAGQSDGAVNDDVIFVRLRRRLERIAYRMLGSVAEAEDIVQDTWLRWNAAAREETENKEAWLASVTRRLSIDRLRAIKIQRQYCSERWLPEHQVSEMLATPQEIHERADDVSTAYLVLLERLTHETRSAFLMREVFDVDYDQVAETLHKTPAACRKLVSRAKEQLRSEGRHFVVSRETHHQLLKVLVRALERGDFARIKELLTEEAAMMGDDAGLTTGPWQQDAPSSTYTNFRALIRPASPPSTVIDKGCDLHVRPPLKGNRNRTRQDLIPQESQQIGMQ